LRPSDQVALQELLVADVLDHGQAVLLHEGRGFRGIQPVT
jgi:hypothetical protein